MQASEDLVVVRHHLDGAAGADPQLHAGRHETRHTDELLDHAAAARGVDLELPPEEVLIFGSPRAGTPLMQRDPRIGYELPLRILVADDGGHTVVTYLNPSSLADRFGIPADLVKNIAGIDKIIDEVVA